jgi:hypothetical protein
MAPPPGFQHHKSCDADYPEKPKNEAPQQLEKSWLNKRELLIQCVDCGAFIIVKKEKP